MKTPLYIVIAFFMVFCAQAQLAISQAEYFWDTDPGQGNATAVLATDGNFNSAFEQLSKTGIAAPGVGLHKFCIRVKDNTGVWGPVFTNIVKVETLVTATLISIAQAECFWDTDPGAGNGTALLAFDGNFNAAFEQFFHAEVVVPQAAGFHVFNARLKDNTGVWGPVFRNVVKVAGPLSVPATSAADAMIVYPNPVSNSFKVENAGTVTMMKLYDIKGSMVKGITSGFDGLIDISGLQPGIYLLVVENSEGAFFSRKLVKE